MDLESRKFAGMQAAFIEMHEEFVKKPLHKYQLPLLYFALLEVDAYFFFIVLISFFLSGRSFKMKCPACRKGFVFEHKSITPLSKCLNLADNCAVCGQKMQLETNNGGGINYALTMILFFLNILWYWPIFGLSYKDNSFLYFVITSTVAVIIIQPWLMRYSRIIFLYFVIGYRGERIQH